MIGDVPTHVCVSLDAEWNISREVGVSIIQIAPHSEPDSIYIIPVHKFKKLPAALLRLLISSRIFLIGSAIKTDLTRLKKQFPQLSEQSFNVIDLKQFAIKRGVLKKNNTEKTLGAYLPKEATFRKSDGWELGHLHPDLLNYAALDVFASRLIFEKINEIAPLDLVEHSTPAGTRIALLVNEGGEIAAYGRISALQPASFAGVRISQSRLLVDIDFVLLPSAAAVLHLSPSSAGRTKSGALMLSQLQSQSAGPIFQLVSPLTHLEFDRRTEPVNVTPIRAAVNPLEMHVTVNHPQCNNESDNEDEDIRSDGEPDLELEAETTSLQLSGKKRARSEEFEEDDFDSSPLGAGLLKVLHKLVETPDDIDSEYTRIKKDIFHAFHMIPIPVHGLRAAFFRTLRDHIMRWDPALRLIVDETCRRVFNITFEVMLIRDPRFIQERVPRYVPPPSVLVPAIQHVFNVFSNATDAESGQPLFNKKSWDKANAVLELAREGYLSDIDGVVLYEKAGVDEYGLQKFKCDRGTNRVEGGPHGDIYRKFGALNAGPRLTVNSLTDHRTRYNLQILFLVPPPIPIGQTQIYMNAPMKNLESVQSLVRDLEPLRIRRDMAPYTPEAASKFKINSSDDWLRRRQGLALPILPPTTVDARKYFFVQIRKFAVLASSTGGKKVDFESFAKEWNHSADGKTRYHVTADVLSSYSKTWDKISNIRASQDLIAAKIDLVRQTGELFSAPSLPFPESLKGDPTITHPRQGVRSLGNDQEIPQSISVGLAISHPRIESTQMWSSSQSSTIASRPFQGPPAGGNSHHQCRSEPSKSCDVQIDFSSVDESLTPITREPNSDPGMTMGPPTGKRRRIVPEDQRKNKMRSCRRCKQSTCPGNSDILNCPVQCTVAWMMYTRAAASDYDDWEKLGNPGWGSADLIPFAKKHKTYQAGNIDSTHGSSGPLKVSYGAYETHAGKDFLKVATDYGRGRRLTHDGNDIFACDLYSILASLTFIRVSGGQSRIFIGVSTRAGNFWGCAMQTLPEHGPRGERKAPRQRSGSGVENPSRPGRRPQISTHYLGLHAVPSRGTAVVSTGVERASPSRLRPVVGSREISTVRDGQQNGRHGQRNGNGSSQVIQV
ncbi:hypothetical protein FB451DRAFT_1170367 [Mycena latifolia]|nr:hypothetical protein FB451DRAFT_1170367 [Mycena latifolia]